MSAERTRASASIASPLSSRSSRTRSAFLQGLGLGLDLGQVGLLQHRPRSYAMQYTISSRCSLTSTSGEQLLRGSPAVHFWQRRKWNDRAT